MKISSFAFLYPLLTRDSKERRERERHVQELTRLVMNPTEEDAGFQRFYEGLNSVHGRIDSVTTALARFECDVEETLTKFAERAFGRVPGTKPMAEAAKPEDDFTQRASTVDE